MIQPGDKVKVNQHYIDNYSKEWIDSIKNKSATVIFVKPLSFLVKGIRNEINELHISFDDGRELYIVSDVGFEKEK